jgi:hypothetical protein
MQHDLAIIVISIRTAALMNGNLGRMDLPEEVNASRRLGYEHYEL